MRRQREATLDATERDLERRADDAERAERMRKSLDKDKAAAADDDSLRLRRMQEEAEKMLAGLSPSARDRLIGNDSVSRMSFSELQDLMRKIKAIGG